ncbi:MAG: hypothetical protein FWG23_08265 [Eggerthellaceae bacterium]|nr:hypothetical protein [Eggerthellaceae bacterium]
MEEKPNYGKAIGGAALVGGVFGVVGMGLVAAYSFTPLYGQGVSIFFVLGTLGLIGAILFLCGVYPKLEAIGGMGAVLPICGFVSAVAGATFGASKATGSAGKGALVAVVELLCKVVLVAIALCCVVATIMHFTNLGTVFTAPYAPGGISVDQVGAPWGSADGPPMGVPVSLDPLSFVWAFVVAALVTATAQAVLMLTKLPVPIYLVILLTLGAILTPFGIMKALAVLGGGGFQVLIVDAGEAITSTFYALLQGNFMPFVYVLLLFGFLFVVGILTGWIKLAMAKGKDASEKDAA